MGKKIWLLGALVTGIACLIAAPVSAQTENVFPTPEQADMSYTIYGGAAFPISGNTNTESMPDLGITWYGPAGPGFGDMASLGLSVDWIPFERNDGENVNIVPFLVNYKQYGVIGNYRVSVNFGIGFLATTDEIPEMKLSSGANFGWTGGLGFDISNNVTFLAKFIGGSNPSDDGMVSFQLGYRF